MTTNKLSSENSAPMSKTLQPSSQAEMDQALAVLTAHKDAWALMDVPSRIALLDQIKQDLPKVEKRWIEAGLAAKGGVTETMAEGEEWYSVTVTYRTIRFLRKALQDIIQYGKPKIPGKVTTRSNGQVVAQVVPYDWKETLALPGMRAEVWMDPSVSLQDGGIPQVNKKHLDPLQIPILTEREQCAIVTSHKRGRVRTYRLTLEPLERAADWLAGQRDHWTWRFDRLDEHLLMMNVMSPAALNSPNPPSPLCCGAARQQYD